MIRICVVTSNRADYGLLYNLIQQLDAHEQFALQIIATGGHFTAQQGETWKAIVDSGFRIDRKVKVLRDQDSGEAVGIESGKILSGMAAAYTSLDPDLVVVLGDRYEILSAVIAAVLQNIPVAHLHGGELTEGAFDDGIRHAITKLAKFHFVAAEEYRTRVIQMGEMPDSVFNVGAFGLDVINNITLINESQLRRELEIPSDGRYAIVTWHPETLSLNQTMKNFQQLLDALKRHRKLFIIFTRPNNDPGGMEINNILDKFAVKNPRHCKIFDSLGMVRFISALKYAYCMIGNSSSGIIEAPAMAIPTINIGDRQQGRLRASSIIDCPADANAISNVIESLSDQLAVADLSGNNPYGNGGAAESTIQALEKILLQRALPLKKEFYDLPVSIAQ